MSAKNTKLSRLSGRYLAALRIHVEGATADSLKEARELGNQAVADGVDTLDLAKMHDEALAILTPTEGSGVPSEYIITRAEEFFTEASIPVEATHRPVLDATNELRRVSEELKRRATDLAETQRELQRGINERRSAEAVLRTVVENPSSMLEESHLREQRLQEKARSILAANEEARKKMAIHLQDEIAQPLLGIQVRLLALEKEAAVGADGIHEEIAATQRMVEESLKTISRFSQEFGTYHEK
jgi:signal transduction histidine kinase